MRNPRVAQYYNTAKPSQPATILWGRLAACGRVVLGLPVYGHCVPLIAALLLCGADAPVRAGPPVWLFQAPNMLSLDSPRIPAEASTGYRRDTPRG